MTPDAVDPTALTMMARINGEGWIRASSGTILWSIEELVAWASTGEQLAARTLLGTGTVGGRCGMELQRMVKMGDTSSLRSRGLGCFAAGSAATPTTVGARLTRVPPSATRS